MHYNIQEQKTQKKIYVIRIIRIQETSPPRPTMTSTSTGVCRSRTKIEVLQGLLGSTQYEKVEEFFGKLYENVGLNGEGQYKTSKNWYI